MRFIDVILRLAKDRAWKELTDEQRKKHLGVVSRDLAGQVTEELLARWSKRDFEGDK